MPDEFKIAVKLGPEIEFNAEGPESLVRQAYNDFLEIAKQKREADETIKPLAAPTHESLEYRQQDQPDNTTNQTFLHRVFRVDGEVVSLRALPKTENANADAVLLLLYGYSVIKGQHDVSAVRLAQSARRSGVRADRMDRILAQSQGYVLRSGIKKGVRYGLNNPGLRRCEESIQNLLG
jgi:hypothetical protein